VVTLCLALPHLFVVHKIVLHSFDKLFALSKGGTDERGGVSKEGLNVLESFVACGERLGMGGEGGVSDGVSVMGCGRWKIRMLTAAVVISVVGVGTAGVTEDLSRGVGGTRGGCQRLVGGK
jgi:hypothetical protein